MQQQQTANSELNWKKTEKNSDLNIHNVLIL